MSAAQAAFQMNQLSGGPGAQAAASSFQMAAADHGAGINKAGQPILQLRTELFEHGLFPM